MEYRKKTHLARDNLARHCALEVDLVCEHRDGRSTVARREQALQLAPGLGDPLRVRRVHHKHHGIGLTQVLPPQVPHLRMTAQIPGAQPDWYIYDMHIIAYQRVQKKKNKNKIRMSWRGKKKKKKKKKDEKKKKSNREGLEIEQIWGGGSDINYDYE
jgi:hypothetical protein